MKKSNTVILLISLVSLLSSYFIIGEYRVGYLGYFLLSLTLLIGVLGINYYSERKLSLNILSVSLILAYLLNTLGFIISTDYYMIFPKMFLNVVLLSSISVELTSEFISSGVIFKQIKGAVLWFVYKLIGMFDFVKLFKGPKLEIKGRSKTITISILLFLLVGLPIVIVVTSLLSSASPEFAKVMKQLFDIQINDIGTNLIRFIVALIFFLYLATEYIFVKKLSTTNFENSEVKTSEVVKKYIVYVSQITILFLNLFYVLFIYIQLRYDFGNLWQYIKDNNVQTFSNLATSRFTELLIVGSINLTILYFLNRPFIKIGLHEITNRLVKLNTVFLGVSTLALIYSAHARLTMYEGGYGFTSTRLNAHLFLLPLIVSTICLVLPILLKKESRRAMLIAVSSFILYFGVMLAIPSVYISNKINLDNYISGNIKRFDVKYTSKEGYFENESAPYGGYGYEGETSSFGAPNDDGLLVLIDFYKHVKSSPKVEFSPYVVENRKILDNRINMLKQTIGNLDDYGVSNGGNYYNYDYLNVVNTKKDNRDFNLMYYFIQKEYKSIKDQIK
jgi:hypothetical protein